MQVHVVGKDDINNYKDYLKKKDLFFQKNKIIINHHDHDFISSIESLKNNSLSVENIISLSNDNLKKIVQFSMFEKKDFLVDLLIKAKQNNKREYLYDIMLLDIYMNSKEYKKALDTIDILLSVSSSGFIPHKLTALSSLWHTEEFFKVFNNKHIRDFLLPKNYIQAANILFYDDPLSYEKNLNKIPSIYHGSLEYMLAYSNFLKDRSLAKRNIQLYKNDPSLISQVYNLMILKEFGLENDPSFSFSKFFVAEHLLNESVINDSTNPTFIKPIILTVFDGIFGKIRKKEDRDLEFLLTRTVESLSSHFNTAVKVPRLLFMADLDYDYSKENCNQIVNFDNGTLINNGSNGDSKSSSLVKTNKDNSSVANGSISKTSILVQNYIPGITLRKHFFDNYDIKNKNGEGNNHKDINKGDSSINSIISKCVDFIALFHATIPSEIYGNLKVDFSKKFEYFCDELHSELNSKFINACNTIFSSQKESIIYVPYADAFLENFLMGYHIVEGEAVCDIFKIDSEVRELIPPQYDLANLLGIDGLFDNSLVNQNLCNYKKLYNNYVAYFNKEKNDSLSNVFGGKKINSEKVLLEGKVFDNFELNYYINLVFKCLSAYKAWQNKSLSSDSTFVLSNALSTIDYIELNFNEHFSSLEDSYYPLRESISLLKLNLR